MELITMLTRLLRLLASAIVLSAVVLAAIWFIGRPERALQGIWHTQSHGLVVEVSPFRMRILELTPVSCQLSATMPAHMGMIRRLAGYDLTRDGERLHIGVADVVDTIVADRLDQLPAQCLEGRPAGPKETFDILWHSFAQFYPNFDLYGVDWDARRQEAMDAIGTSLDPEHLSDVMRHSLRDLDDAHVNLVSPSGRFSPAQPPEWSAIQRQIWAVTDRYIDTTGDAPADVVAGADIKHGWISEHDGIAYMRFHHMEPAQSLGKQLADAALVATDTLTERYKDAAGVVLDLRYNAGGSDVVALIYAGMFTQRAYAPILKRSTTGQNTWTDQTPLVVPDLPDAITAPIVILTSERTVSSGEVFTLALRQGDSPERHVTLVGTPTAGAFSDMLARSLPNGWQFTLSHQSYETQAGETFEGTGIPVDIALPLDIDGFDAGRDTQLEAALSLLQP